MPDEIDIERRPMGVHDALEAWAEGRLSVGRALELTHAADVAEMIVLCHVNGVSRPLLAGPDVAAAAVEAAIRARLTGDPSGVPGGVPEPLGEPGE